MSTWKAEHSQNRPDMSLITRDMRDEIAANPRILREEVERITGQKCRLWNAAMKEIVAEYGKGSQREVYAEGTRTAFRITSHISPRCTAQDASATSVGSARRCGPSR